MGDAYRLIEILVNERACHRGVPLPEAVLELVRARRIAARCLVLKGVGGLYESGEMATQGIEALSFDMPVKIEIHLPAAELPDLLPDLEAMVRDGMLLVSGREVVAHRAGYRLLPRHLKVRDVMTSPVRSVSPDAPVAALVDLLLDAPFKGLPVVDDASRPLGMITPVDLVERGGLPMRPGLLASFEREKVRALLAEMPPRRADEIMTAPALTVSEGEPLVAAAETMLERHLKRMPVVDERGALTGMLSRFDIFRSVSRDGARWGELARGDAPVEVRGGRTVGDVMTRDAGAVDESTPLSELVRLFAAPGAERRAVVDRAGTLVGMLSDRILLDALVERRPGLRSLLPGGFSFAKWSSLGGEGTDARVRHARDVMCREPVAVREETPVEEAIRIMTERSLKRLPVVDGTGRFLGMVGRDRLLAAGLAPEADGAAGA